MTDRKTTVHRLEHLRVDKLVSFILPLLFQFAKRNEKVMPPLYVLNLHPAPLSLVVIFSYAPL